MSDATMQENLSTGILSQRIADLTKRIAEMAKHIDDIEKIMHDIREDTLPKPMPIYWGG